MTEKERYSLEQDKNAYKCITDNTNDNLLCTREEIVNRLNQQEKEITEQRIFLNNKEEQLKEYEKLIKEILLETRGHITERKYYALVGVSPQTYYTLKNLIQEW